MLNASKSDWPHDKNITATTDATGAGPVIQSQTGEQTPMSALDPFLSLDGQIQKIRQDHDTKLKAVNDQLMAAQIELVMTKKALVERTQERDQSERVALKLVTQFGMVEKIFAEAKALALSFESTHGGKPSETKTDQPKVGPLTPIFTAMTPYMIDGVQAPDPTHDASWQNPETGKWYDAINGGPPYTPGSFVWVERPPSQIEFEPSDATRAAITG